MRVSLDEEAIPPRFEDTADRATYLLKEYKAGVYLAVAAGVALVLSGRLGLPTVPPLVVDWLYVLIIGIIPSMLVAKTTVIKWFVPDPRVRVLVLEYDRDDAILNTAAKKVPRDLWNERKHSHGMPVLEPDGAVDAIVTQYEYDAALEQITVRGANPELVDPVDLLATQGRLESLFNEMLEQSREYEHLKATLSLRQQEMEQRITNALVAAVEQGTTFEPASDVLETELYGESKIPDPETEQTESMQVEMQDTAAASAPNQEAVDDD